MAVISSPVRLSGRRCQAISPHAANEPPTSRYTTSDAGTGPPATAPGSARRTRGGQQRPHPPQNHGPRAGTANRLSSAGRATGFGTRSLARSGPRWRPADHRTLLTRACRTPILTSPAPAARTLLAEARRGCAVPGPIGAWTSTGLLSRRSWVVGLGRVERRTCAGRARESRRAARASPRGWLAVQPASRRGAVEPGPAFERSAAAASPRRCRREKREQRDGAAHEGGDRAPDVGVGDVLAVRDRGEPDRAVGLGPVEPARHGVGHARAGAATRGRPELFLALGAEPLEQPE